MLELDVVACKKVVLSCKKVEVEEPPKKQKKPIIGV